MGYLFGTVMAVTGATYPVNLAAAAAFKARADVAGAGSVAVFSPVSSPRNLPPSRRLR
jgi:hypothetical protein